MVTNEQNPQSQSTSGTGGNSGKVDQVRQKAKDTYAGARDGVSRAYDSTRQGVSKAGRRATGQIDEAPLIALAGGFAFGALIASLLPKTKTEEELLRPVSRKVSEGARTAAEAAREAGTSRLRELGLTPDAGREALRNLFDGVGDAAKTSAQAAVGAVRSESDTGAASGTNSRQ